MINFLLNIDNIKLIMYIISCIIPFLIIMRHKLIIILNKILDKLFPNNKTKYINQKETNVYFKNRKRIKLTKTIKIENELEKQKNIKIKQNNIKNNLIKEQQLKNKEFKIKELKLDKELNELKNDKNNNIEDK